MANITGYKFSDKSHSTRGIFSTVLGTMALIMLIILIRMATVAGGKGSIYLGSIGLVAIALNIIGLIFGMLGFLERDKYPFFAKVGAIWNLLLLVGWASIIMIGA